MTGKNVLVYDGILLKSAYIIDMINDNRTQLLLRSP
jgi:hypothetical protein